MEIKCLNTGFFRNLSPVSTEFHPRLNLIAGDNGQGKTNLLEAIALVCGLPSFRTSDTRVLPAEGSSEAMVTARISPSSFEDDGSGKHQGTLGCSIMGPSKQMYWNGNKISQLTARNLLPAVFLTSADRERLGGSPDVRRKGMDRIAFALDPEHLRTLQLFEKARASRTRLLIQAHGFDPEEMKIYEEIFAEHGANVLIGRRNAVSTFSSRFQEEAQRLKSPFSELSLVLVSDVDPEGNKETVRERLKSVLVARRKEEKAAGRCLVGPHRNDIQVLSKGQKVTSRASSGESRLLVLAWTLAEIGILISQGGRTPLFVFDDFDAEWDQKVLARFAENLPRSLQMFFTSARSEATAAFFSSECQLFTMTRGELSRSHLLERDSRTFPATRLVTLK